MIENFIYRPDSNKENEVNKEYYFTSQEFSQDFDKDNNCYITNDDSKGLAKKIFRYNKTIYQIKTTNNNELFNPFSKLDREKSYSFLDNVVRRRDKFINVSSLVFEYYLKFLVTKNPLWLTKAERERV